MQGSTRHSYSFANTEKRERLASFVAEYNRVCLFAIDFLWEHLEEDLKVSKYPDYKEIPIESSLARRAFQCAVNQAGAIIRGAVEKQKRRLWVRKNKNPNVKDVKIKKPALSFIAPQLNANCLDFEEDSEGHFEGFVRVSSIGKEFGSNIKIPINKSSQYNKWKKERSANLCGSLKLFRGRFQLAWDWERTPHAQGSKVLGMDQGLKTVCTLSDGQKTPDFCPHGHSLQSILEKLSEKKKGSVGFQKTVAHRKNFVHWSVNQLNFQGVKEVRLEKVVNVRLGKSSSRIMSHWCNPEIRDKIKRRCEELEVPVVEQSCAYRSQRCSQCGQVRKANRKGKVYQCKNCGSVLDADLNAALNHEQDLTPIPFAFLGQKLNLKDGFFWRSSGLFKPDGSELIVQSSQKTDLS